MLNGGRLIPHGATLELTTRSKRTYTPFCTKSKLPDFWLSKTQNFATAFHEPVGRARDGVVAFTDIGVKQVGEQVSGWERNHVEILQDLAKVLHQVIGGAKQLGGSCIVSYGGGPGIDVVRVDEGEIPNLPEDLQALFIQDKIKEEEDANEGFKQKVNEEEDEIEDVKQSINDEDDGIEDVKQKLNDEEDEMVDIKQEVKEEGSS